MENLSHALQSVLQDPAKFKELSSEFDDEVDCYLKLLREAKKSLSSFDELHRFYSIAIEEGPTEFVLHDLDRNAARSIKNMVLGSSRAGRQFPINSIEELQDRVDAYQNLGEDIVTAEAVVFTIVEHMLDQEEDQEEDIAQAYERFRLLLDNATDLDTSREINLVPLLVRSRLVFAAEMMSHKQSLLELYIEEFLDDIPDPRPDDNRTAIELFDAAEKKSYADPQKIELVQSSLARQRDEERLVEYLYLSARDVPERYRHDSREDPWRGELQLTRLQFQCLLNTFADKIKNGRENRIRSYRDIVIAEIQSGGRWRSQRDSNQLPEPNFLSASDRYIQAAEKIWSVDKQRGIKYFSKSFRQQAAGIQKREWGSVNGWEQTVAIHAGVKQLLADLAPEDASEDLLETITETSLLHTFLEHQAKAIVEFENRNMDQIVQEVEAAWELIDPIPVYVDTNLLKDIETLHEGLQHEQHHSYSEALKAYNSLNSEKIGLQNRINLVKIKQDVFNDDLDSAIEIAETHFENTPILTMAEIAAGRSSSSTGVKPPVLEDLSAVDPDTKWVFVHISAILGDVNQISPQVSEQAKELLLEL